MNQTENGVNADPPPFLESRAKRYALYLGFWTMLVGIDAAETYVWQQTTNHPITWTLAFRRSFEEWYLWAALGLAVLWFGRRVRFQPGNGPRWATIHTVASALASSAYIAAYALLLAGQKSIDGTTFTFWSVIRKVVVHYLPVNMIIYWLVVLAQEGWFYYKRYRQGELQAAELQRQLAEAKLDALRMQLNPHFLFNTLHAISSLIHDDPEKADRVVVGLSQLLRLSLDHSDAHEVPLRQELAFLDRYLEIEQTRFGDRLGVEIDVPANLLGAMVPCLILQPLVENAIRHGIETREDSGRVTIRARRLGERVELVVADNGPGLVANGGALPREGIGLSNTRSRLRHLYGEEQQLTLSNVPGGGLQVSLVIPCHVYADEPVPAHAG